MPYADPQDKKRWLHGAIANGYGKWLYQKRKRVYMDANEFQAALEKIVEIGDLAAVRTAEKALAESKERWDSLGPANAGPISVKAQKPDSLIEAVAKLGLK